jgi:hypothetical protein
MKYLKIFEQWANNITDVYIDDLSTQQINENQESVGREFQHIEDLVYIYGIPGVKRAIERLETISKSNEHMEIKWDGSPAIIFGRDENGTFHFGDKYTKEIVDSSEKVYQQYVGRSGANVSDDRRRFASSMSELWKLYESATPENFRGYIEGGLLYKTTPPLNKQNEYVFQPNTVIYHVDKNSELGKRIGDSITGAAATAYFDNLPALGGSRITTDLSKIIRGIGNRSVVIVPPKYATDVQVQVPVEKLNKLKSYVSQVSDKINQFITPSQEWIDSYPDEQTATKKWREVIYKYVNSQVDNPQGMENLGSNMAQWAETDPLLTKGRRPLAIAKIKQDQSAMQATFLVVRSIMHLKDTIVDQMENRTLGSLGIRAELPGGAPGGEGFVSDPAGGSQPLKFVKRGTFTAANREKNRGGVNENKESSSATAVVGWGRGMGHRGHMYLAESVIDYANRIGATPFFFVSETVGPDDPLEPKTKLEIYRQVFPQYSEIFRTGKTPVQVLEQVRELGYTNVVFMVGEDQRDSFQWLTKPTKSTGQLPADMQSIKVMSRQESGSKTSNLSGPRATPMRDALKDESLSFEEKFKIWRDAMPEKLTDAQVKKIMSIAAKRMNVELKLKEAERPPLGSTLSAISGTPQSLQPQPDKKEIEAYHRELQSIKRFMHRDNN